jgi:DNA-binding CsgD family transcriptional regulator
VLDRIDTLPAPQQAALHGAFGLTRAEPRDRFFTGLAVLSLLSALAEDRPLLCLVDDAQWLDLPSARALLFVARRLDAEGIALVFAARDQNGAFPAPDIADLPLRRLDAPAAMALLAEHNHDLTPQTRHRVLAEAAGNPLALIELPAALSVEPPAGEVRTARTGGQPPLTSRLQQTFLSQVLRLPESTQTLLLVGAAEDAGDLHVILCAAATFGVSADDLAPAEQTGLVLAGAGTLAFRHPLIRAAVYQAVPLGRRVAVHRALADASGDPSRRAWHLASASTGPDDDVAAELERAAVLASERSGYAAAAAAYERSAELTADRDTRVRRLTSAAEAAGEAGDLDLVLVLAERAGTPADVMIRARMLHARAIAEFYRGSRRTAHELLIGSAQLISDSDSRQAVRMLYLALRFARYLGGRELVETADRLETLGLSPTDPLAPVSRFLISSVVSSVPQTTHRPAEHLLLSLDAVAQARSAADGDPHVLMTTGEAGLDAGQDEQASTLFAALAADCRAQGRISWLAPALGGLAMAQLVLGRHRDALASASESQRIAADIGLLTWKSYASAALAYLAAVDGDEVRCRRLAEEALAIAPPDNTTSLGVSWAYWALSLLDLGLGRAQAASSRLLTLTQEPARHQTLGIRSTPDLVEAAVRLGEPSRVAQPLARFEEWARLAGAPSIDALILRCQALLAPGEDAEEHYAAALKLHVQSSRPFEHARTELLYGEWLRRARRKSDARTHLRTALDTFERLGALPWAARARTELTATGTPAPPRQVPSVLARLTPQELQIVRFAAQGLSNRDIAAQLFLSPRTVGYHLYKAYPKLGIASRKELGQLTLAETNE